MKYGYLLEIEHISATQFSDKALQREIAEAEAQLRQYAADPRIQAVAEKVTLKNVALIYKGWELVYAAEVEI